jgi:hypothetical protein
MTSSFHCSSPASPLGTNQTRSVLGIKGVHECIRLRLLDAEFCSITFNKVIDKIGILTSLHGRRLVFTGLFVQIPRKIL